MSMTMRWRCAFAAAAIALGAQSVLAQPVNGCPPGQAMQSSDPSGRTITCVPIPDTANILNLLNAETAAREAGDQALHARIDGLTEADIVGRWSVSGTTSCLQSSNGFNTTTMTPLIPATGSTTVSQISGTFIGTRTFNAGGTGHSVGTSHSMTFPGTFFGTTFSGIAGTGGGSVATLDAGFTWTIEADGTLLIDDGTIVQPFTAPPSRVGFTVTIANVPPFVGHISKDRRTITLTHPGMSIETSTVHDPAGVVAFPPTPRFCARARVLTRLPD